MSKKTTKPKTKSKTTKPGHKVIWAKWLDHTATAFTWTDRKDIIRDVLVCESVGFLVDEDEKVLRLALMGDGQDNFSNIIKIVKSCIVKRKNMK